MCVGMLLKKFLNFIVPIYPLLFLKETDEINTRLLLVRRKHNIYSQRMRWSSCVVMTILQAWLPSLLLWRVMAGSFEFLDCIVVGYFVIYSPRRMHWTVSGLHISLTMNFSELFKQTNQLSRFSPNGKYLVSS